MKSAESGMMVDFIQEERYLRGATSQYLAVAIWEGEGGDGRINAVMRPISYFGNHLS